MLSRFQLLHLTPYLGETVLVLHQDCNTGEERLSPAVITRVFPPQAAGQRHSANLTVFPDVQGTKIFERVNIHNTKGAAVKAYHKVEGKGSPQAFPL